ncbi:P-loop containing nucleoside triphosphate hydrolase protein, partial [Rhizophagus irregularis]
MTYEIEKMNLIPEFSGLQAPKFLTNLQLLPHQVEAAQTVIEKMNGKAILADEVGLGKTIEAGLIMKEYMIRGLVKKTLILVPASLQNQWVTELNDYDMIIIDEAHKLKNHKTQVYQFVQSLKKKFCLLLTATPIQNDVFEIFYLVSLLKPGHLGNFETFQSSFSATKHGLEQEKFLKELVNQVMVRNRRQDTGIEWTTRKVKTVPVQFTEDERKVYDKIVELKNVSSIFTSSFTMVTLLKEMCSSKEATFLTLNIMKEKCITKEEIDYIEEIIEMLMNLEVNSKAEQ